MNKLNIFLIFFSIILGVSSSSFFSLWVFMELNLLAVLQLLRFSKKSFTNSLKYFISQALGSVILFIRARFSSIKFNPELVLLRGIVGRLWKLGAFPFHLWFLNIRIDCNWVSFFILSSIQKILPITILEIFSNYFLSLFATLGASFVVCGCFGQNSIKKIFIYSSIFSIRWIIFSLVLRNKIWTLILLIYTSLIGRVFFLFSRNQNISFLSNSFLTLPYPLKLTLVTILFIIRGFPPLAGFILKISILKIIFLRGFSIISFFIVICSIFVILLYLAFSLNVFLASEFSEVYWISEVKNWRAVIFIVITIISVDSVLIV